MRQRVFNVPASVLGFIVVLAVVHLIRNLIPEQLNIDLTLAMAFIPARFSGTPSLLPIEIAGGNLTAATSFVSYMLLHGDLTHLVINSAWLLAFGGAVALRIGGAGFIAFSLFCSVCGALVFLAFNWGLFAPMVGASGAVSGLMAGALRFFFAAQRLGGSTDMARASKFVPLTPVQDMFRDPQILTVLAVWVALNFMFALGGQVLTGGAAIAWEAHLGGFMAGLLGFGYFDRAVRPLGR